MRRFASLGVAAVTTIALALPALATTATAAPGSSSANGASAVAEKAKPKAKKKKLKVKKSADGVQPGISKLVLTVRGAKGKVKFKIKGDNGVTVKGKAKAKKNKAEYLVPALGTGQYKVKVKNGKAKGKTKFEVYDSALTVNTTTLTCYIDRSRQAQNTQLSGSIKYKGGPATTGFIDFYKDGNIAGGNASPSFLGFDSFNPPGSGQFNTGGDFCTEITNGVGLAGGNLAPLPAGQYVFQIYYTADAGYDDYISSNLLTVNVLP